ncbi:hypothetical protein MSAN_02279900 [Mycena sanguinolenta]|uniref:Protein kinase domain-containing protein n=1 Tax=Mycena sanguinolenta TaxID=230812 RepID=A0A8H6XAP0_9AGAR|nr:hypothetical protein MSAN_02279900 [Mycena sanguinolenta]
MDPQVDSDEEFIVLSTSDYTESASYAFAQAGGLKGNAKLFVKSIGFLPSLLGARVTEFQASGTARTHIRKYSETMRRQIADHRSVTNYNYIINGGRGGSGGEGGDQGGDGGAGHGPTVNFGQPQAREVSAFRTIRLGDIKLIKEFKEIHFGVVDRPTSGASVRRVYKAKLEGHESDHMTVAMYEGAGAEEAWSQDLAKYEIVRHPNVIQLYGVVSTKGLYAMVFHDELIPFTQFLRRFQHSPILSTYILGFWDAVNYAFNVFPKSSIDYIIWVRPPTGELCLDLAPSAPGMGIELGRWWNIHILRLENISLDAPDSEDIIITTLSEDQYHTICTEPPIAQFHFFQVSTQHPVGPGIFWWDSQHGTCVRIMEPLILLDEELCWNSNQDEAGELYGSYRTCPLRLELPLSFSSYPIKKAWLAQANCIFAEPEEEAHVEDYVCVYQVLFTLRVENDHHIDPKGYLFVCPVQDFRISTKNANLYQWPACPAYWSLDLSGAERLSTEDARILGFPAIHIETAVFGASWDRSVYNGLRQFHQGKGFDPDSREVARRLGYPLYDVLSDCVPFAAREFNYSLCDFEDPELCREFVPA